MPNIFLKNVAEGMETMMYNPSQVTSLPANGSQNGSTNGVPE